MFRLTRTALAAAFLGVASLTVYAEDHPSPVSQCETIDQHLERLSATLGDEDKQRLVRTVSTPEVADQYFAVLDAIPNSDGSVDDPTQADAVVMYYVDGAPSVSVFPALDGLVCGDGWQIGITMHLQIWQIAEVRAEQESASAEAEGPIA
jgi:hypothetical protein